MRRDKNSSVSMKVDLKLLGETSVWHEKVPPVATTTWTVRVAGSAAEVQALRGTWEQLQCHPNTDIDSYLTFLDRHPTVTPYVMVLSRSGAAEAMVVGRIDPSTLEIRIGYKTLCHPHTRMLTILYGGLLGDITVENAPFCFSEIVSCLRKGQADIAFFNSLKTDSPLCELVLRRSSLVSRDLFAVTRTHRSMTVPSSVDQLWSNLSPKVRKNQRSQAKRFTNDYSGKVMIRSFRDLSEVEIAMRDMEKIASKSYQRGLGVGFVDSADMRSFFSLKAQRGWLRSYVLYVGEEPCAFWSGTAYRGIFHSDFMGYDVEFKKYSPGMYLIMKVLEELCAGGQKEIDVIDFGMGDAQYKEVLGSTQWQDVSCYLFPPTPKGLALNALRTPAAFVDRVARNALERTALLHRVKKMWRAGVRPSASDDPVCSGNSRP